MIVFVVTGILLGISGVVMVLTSSGNLSKGAMIQIRTTPAPQIELITWTDQAGFTFQYPKGLSVNKHDEDTANYAQVELTAPSHPGSIIVWAKDSKWTDIDTWVKGDARFTGATIADTSLGGQPGKKALLTGPPQQRIVGTISDNILFTVEGTLTDNDYWSAIVETIANSFKFTTDTTEQRIPNGSTNVESGNDDISSGDGPVDETEVVE